MRNYNVSYTVIRDGIEHPNELPVFAFDEEDAKNQIKGLIKQANPSDEPKIVFLKVTTK